jgi:hypothetical protein
LKQEPSPARSWNPGPSGPGVVKCLAPDAHVLTADYRWIPAGDVRIGDQLIGFDEHNTLDKHLNRHVPTAYRRWRRADVQAVKTIRKSCYRLVFDDGTKLTASADHMWLCSGPPRRNRGMRWQTTERLICNRATQRSWVVKLLDVIKREKSRNAGWLAGFYDGEGNIISAGVTANGWRVSVAQKLDPEVNLCEQLLNQRGFDVQRFTKQRTKNCQPIASLVLRGGKPEVLRFLSLIGPQRLIRNFNDRALENSTLHGHCPVGLVNKEHVGEQDVVAIQTSTRTFIAEGLASHNCFWRTLRDQPETLERAHTLTPHSRVEHTEKANRGAS